MGRTESTNRDGDAAVATSARWQRLADRLARYAWLILVAAVAIALVGGAIVAVAGESAGGGAGEGPGLPDLPWIVSTLGYGLAILLGVPSLLAGAWDLLCGRGSAGARRLLAFVGPVLAFAGIEVLPHLLNPCSLPYEFGERDLPGICESDPEWGADVEGRYHLFAHALAGGLPMAAIYRLALRRWRPDISAGRTTG